MAGQRWTRDEIEYLKTAALSLPSTEIAHNLGRGIQGVRHQARKHGIVFHVEQKADGELRKRWTKAEEFKLEGLAASGGAARAARLLGRTPGAVKRKASKMGVSFRDRKMTIQEVADILQVGFSTVTRRRDKLKLQFRTTNQNKTYARGQMRGATGDDICALAKDILANPPMGKEPKCSATHLTKVIEEYRGWE